MRSVWLCSRNDAIVNMAVILASIGVWATQHRWPDILVAICIGLLGITSAYTVIKQALKELRKDRHLSL